MRAMSRGAAKMSKGLFSLDILAIRVGEVMRVMNNSKDPRYSEIAAIYRQGMESDSERSGMYHGGHRAVFLYLEDTYPDLYAIIQKSFRNLNKTS